MEKKKLKVNDVVYAEKYNSIIGKYPIGRVTDKFAFSGNTRFYIEYDNLEIRKHGRDKWDNTDYLIETPEILQRLERAAYTRIIMNADLNKLTHEQIKVLAVTIRKFLKENET